MSGTSTGSVTASTVWFDPALLKLQVNDIDAGQMTLHGINAASYTGVADANALVVKGSASISGTLTAGILVGSVAAVQLTGTILAANLPSQLDSIFVNNSLQVSSLSVGSLASGSYLTGSSYTSYSSVTGGATVAGSLAVTGSVTAGALVGSLASQFLTGTISAANLPTQLDSIFLGGSLTLGSSLVVGSLLTGSALTLGTWSTYSSSTGSIQLTGNASVSGTLLVGILVGSVSASQLTGTVLAANLPGAAQSFNSLTATTLSVGSLVTSTYLVGSNSCTSYTAIGGANIAGNLLVGSLVSGTYFSTLLGQWFPYASVTGGSVTVAGNLAVAGSISGSLAATYLSGTVLAMNIPQQLSFATLSVGSVITTGSYYSTYFGLWYPYSSVSAGSTSLLGSLVVGSLLTGSSLVLSSWSNYSSSTGSIQLVGNASLTGSLNIGSIVSGSTSSLTGTVTSWTSFASQTGILNVTGNSFVLGTALSNCNTVGSISTGSTSSLSGTITTWSTYSSQTGLLYVAGNAVVSGTVAATLFVGSFSGVTLNGSSITGSVSSAIIYGPGLPLGSLSGSVSTAALYGYVSTASISGTFPASSITGTLSGSTAFTGQISASSISGGSLSVAVLYGTYLSIATLTSSLSVINGLGQTVQVFAGGSTLSNSLIVGSSTGTGLELCYCGAPGVYASVSTAKDGVVRVTGGGRLLLQSGVAASGQPAITINSSNQVGILNNTPAYPLDVQGTGNFTNVHAATLSGTMLTLIDNLSCNGIGGTVATLAVSMTAGQCYVGTIGTNQWVAMGNSYFSLPAANLAVQQSISGATTINFAPGAAITLQTGSGTAFLTIGPTQNTFSQPVVMNQGCNVGTGTAAGAGNLTVQGSVTAGNLVTTGTVTASNMVVSGSVTAGNFTAGTTTLGNVVTTGTVTAGNLVVGNFVTGNILAGNAFMGLYTPGSGTCSVGNTQVTAPNYGFMQNTFGATYINFAAGQSILFQTGVGTNFMQIGPSSITVNQPAVMMQGCNVGTGTAAGAGNLAVAASLTAASVGINSSANALYQLYVNGIANATTAVYGGQLLVGVLSGTLTAVILNLGLAAPSTGWGFYQNSSGATTINAAIGQAVNINNGGSVTVATFNTLSASFSAPNVTMSGNLSVTGSLTSSGYAINAFGITNNSSSASSATNYALQQTYQGVTSINSASGMATTIYSAGTTALATFYPTITYFNTPVNVGNLTVTGTLSMTGSLALGTITTSSAVTAALSVTGAATFSNNILVNTGGGAVSMGGMVGLTSIWSGITNNSCYTGIANSAALVQNTSGQTNVNAPVGQSVCITNAYNTMTQISSTLATFNVPILCQNVTSSGISCSSITASANVQTAGQLIIKAAVNASLYFYWGGQTANNFSIVCPNSTIITILNQASVGVYLASGYTSWTANSDAREKKNIEQIDQLESHANVLQLNPVKFHYNADDDTRDLRQGLIAQEVQKLFPEIVTDNDGKLGICYTELIPYLICSIKEQHKQIVALQDTVAKLIARP